MGLYEIVLQQMYAGQQCVNKWNYRSSEIPTGVSGAFKALVGMGFAPDTDIVAFGPDTIAGHLQALQYQGATFVQAIAKNIFDPLDYYTYAFPAGTHGAVESSQGLSPAAAYSFSTNRSRSDIHRGQKRFVGVVEANVDNLGVINSTALTALQALGDTMADVNLVPLETGSIQYTPYVFGTVDYVAPSGKKAYKYYPSEATQLEHIMLITQWTPKDTMRTQVSRQYGHGK